MGFVVPGTVVEVLVIVGDLVAVQPVDGHAFMLLVYVVPVLSRASSSSVQPTTVKPSLYVRMSTWPAAARSWIQVL